MDGPLHRELTPPPLPRAAAGWRLARGALALLPWAGLAVLFASPGAGLWAGRFRGWTGLPCPFCGGTRALHALARADWAAAFYYNPLAFAAVLGAAGWTAWWAGEALRGRPWPAGWLLRHRRPLGSALLAGLGLFWALHIVLALVLPKPELLDAGGWVWRLWGR